MANAVLGRAHPQAVDFTGAFLLGAVFCGSDLSTVIWNTTACPDGSTSNAHRNTCIGHLEAANVVE